MKSDVCAKSRSWNSGSARHWASVILGGLVLKGINTDFSVRLLSLCFTFALLAVELLSATFVCLSYVSWSSCAAAYFAFFSVCSCLIFPSFLSCPFCCLPFFSFLYYFPSSFLFGLIVFSFVSLPFVLSLFFFVLPRFGWSVSVLVVWGRICQCVGRLVEFPVDVSYFPLHPFGCQLVS